MYKSADILVRKPQLLFGKVYSMARVRWSFYNLLVLAYTFIVVSGKNNEKIPILLPVEELNQLQGFYVKDNDNGELRFLANNANFNNAISNLITQQQNFLEQLRPNSGNTVPAISLSGNGAITGLPNNGANNGINPIVVNLGGSTGTNNANVNTAIQALLPQIIAQVVANNNGAGNNNGAPVNNGVINRRRPIGNRNRVRPNLIVLRP